MINASPLSAPVGTVVLDTVADLTAARLQQILDARITCKQAGVADARVGGLILYMPFSSAISRWDWDEAELDRALGAGLGCGFVQRCRLVGWKPSAALGTSSGKAIAQHALRLRLPSETQLWCDLEGVSQSATAGDVWAYCEAWAKEVLAARFLPGLYVGANSRLTGWQAGQLPSFAAYWKSLSNVPTPQPRGFCMRQVKTIKVANTDYDLDITGEDTRGGRPIFLWKVE